MSDDGDEEGLFGAGTDLIVSLCALLLIVVAMIGSLLFFRTESLTNANTELTRASGDITKLEETAEQCQRDLDVAMTGAGELLEQERARLRACERRGNAIAQVRDELRDEVEDYRVQIGILEAEVVRLENLNVDLGRRLEVAEDRVRSIILSGSELRFAAGSFQIPSSDTVTLRRRVEEIRETAQEYGINTIEVVGHTDGEPVGSNRTSNLDARLGSASTVSTDSIRGARPADNVGLGMLRAISVAEFLEDELRGEGFTILTLSAGQLIDTSDRPRVSPFNQERVERRRVEIRLRRSE